jgi:hypothetical protein
MAPYQQNPDRISPQVIGGGLAGAVVAAVARALIDRYVNPADQEQAWNAFQTVIVPLLPAIGAWLGGLRAKRDVTAIRIDKGDTPRDQAGNALTTISPTRAARPDELPRLFPPGESQTELGP